MPSKKTKDYILSVEKMNWVSFFVIPFSEGIGDRGLKS